VTGRIEDVPVAAEQEPPVWHERRGIPAIDEVAAALTGRHRAMLRMERPAGWRTLATCFRWNDPVMEPWHVTSSAASLCSSSRR